MAEHNEIGKWGEEIAAEYLRKKGYVIKERDWRYKHRDIDLIALTEDMRTLVFVEVKTRSSQEVSSPEDAITRDKIKSIGYSANAYVKMNRIMSETRFDIITVVGAREEGVPVVEHWEDAFDPMMAY
ncbi:MAG: YraN family protein [Prevotella sp.]|nr:YraN family protein [Prevotella sp.]